MELKVILYIIAGVAYFIYKQFQKLQKEAITRQVKINAHQNSGKAGNSKEINSIEELFVSKQDLKTSETTFHDNQKVVKKSKQIESTAASLASFSNNQNMNEEEYYSEQSSVKTVQKSYSQIRNMILFSELLKRPTY
jgi:Na+-transporting NADH:ubiquinone oxidoreductase subunit NqrC